MQAAFYQAILPILRTGASLQQGLGGVSGGLKHADELERENARLKLENRQLQATNNLLKNSEAEVNRLNRALGYKEQSSFRLIPARIISRDSATWWNSCTIDRGAADGIATDMAVVTETGLVGKVTSVANDVAVVLLLSDESLRVSVTIEGTQEQGIVSGTRASTNYAPDLRIRFLSKTANLKPGLNVFTAGAGGVFPSGVLIGQVKDFTVKELEGVAKVKPAVDLAEIRDVFVIIGRK
jgi:rod shape-determining protein MreC